MFYNISNHPVSAWSIKQRQAALDLASPIIDIPFPAVDASASKDEIQKMAAAIVRWIPEHSVAMVQGEMTLTYALVNKLKSKNVRTLAACSVRDTVEEPSGDSTVKNSKFTFVRFRDY